MHNGNVLVVDDELQNIELAELILKKEGYTLFFACEGKEAFTLLHQHDIHVLVLDLMLPDVDGFTILKELKSDPRYKNIEVIVVSALNDVGSIERAKALGATAYINKPYDIISLKSKVKESLKQYKLTSLDIESFLDESFEQMSLHLDEVRIKSSVIEFLTEPSMDVELCIVMQYLQWFCSDEENCFLMNAKALRHKEYKLVGEKTLDKLQSCMNKILIRSSIKDKSLILEDLFKSSTVYFLE